MYQTEIYQPIGNPDYRSRESFSTSVPGTALLLPHTVQRICSKVGSILAIAIGERVKVKPTFLQTGKRADVQREGLRIQSSKSETILLSIFLGFSSARPKLKTILYKQEDASPKRVRYVTLKSISELGLPKEQKDGVNLFGSRELRPPPLF